jgi:hypothetical protein
MLPDHLPNPHAVARRVESMEASQCIVAVVRPRVAPVIAITRERAGRVKGAERRSGPLTRPSAPGKLGAGATAKPGRDHSWKVGRSTCEHRARSEALFAVSSWRKLALTSVRILRQYSHARPSTSPTLTWGVSDPAGGLLGRVHSVRAGSLTPFPCCDTCAGAFTGRHKPPPHPASARPAQHRVVQWVAASR